MRLLVLIGVTVAAALGGAAAIFVLSEDSDSSDGSRRDQHSDDR
jgi:hypothetical protein